jgi:hypothetical protein
MRCGQKVRFSMAGMCRGQRRQIQHGCYVSGQKVRFSMAGMCHGLNDRFNMTGMCRGQKRQIPHGYNVLLSKKSDSP